MLRLALEVFDPLLELLPQRLRPAEQQRAVRRGARARGNARARWRGLVGVVERRVRQDERLALAHAHQISTQSLHQRARLALLHTHAHTHKYHRIWVGSLARLGLWDWSRFRKWARPVNSERRTVQANASRVICSIEGKPNGAMT